MSPAHGRPPSKDPKTHETRIRMSDGDRDKLNFCCNYYGLTKADVIRAGIGVMYERATKKGDDEAKKK